MSLVTFVHRRSHWRSAGFSESTAVVNNTAGQSSFHGLSMPKTPWLILPLAWFPSNVSWDTNPASSCDLANPHLFPAVYDWIRRSVRVWDSAHVRLHRSSRPTDNVAYTLSTNPDSGSCSPWGTSSCSYQAGSSVPDMLAHSMRSQTSLSFLLIIISLYPSMSCSSNRSTQMLTPMPRTKSHLRRWM